MNFESAVTFFIAIFIFGITPGPGVFAILARALTQGSAKCWWLALGMNVSDILYLVAACLGLAVIAQHWQWLFDVVKIVGALYLFYLAWLMWQVSALTDFSNDNEQANASGFRLLLMSFVQGFLISISNVACFVLYCFFAWVYGYHKLVVFRY